MHSPSITGKKAGCACEACEGIFFCLMLSFPFVMAGSASLPGIVTYCHCIPAPHSGTACPPMRARPLCKYRVTARAPACSRQGPITPATAPSHRLVKIVHFPSFLFPPLSLSSCFDFILFFSFSSLCLFIIPLYIPCLPILPFSFLVFLPLRVLGIWSSSARCVQYRYMSYLSSS